ncbi:protein of unassigned function [Methylobacterium oryzae CBMB20]|uniref:Protein of unassigned function n=1 Tax=Methylobacterium oryzae CBMB20 TaxID=693986 RepID=A0A089Q6A1_9HYPH|nr:protein of unassigned function [Methylobacterium oryzae CBMB20]
MKPVMAKSGLLMFCASRNVQPAAQDRLAIRVFPPIRACGVERGRDV